MATFDIKAKQQVKYFKYNKEEAISNENIELNFDLINGKINNYYKLHLKNLDLKENNSFSSDYIKISNTKQTINLLKYNCIYSFGREQKLNMIIEIKDDKNSQNSEIYPIKTTIGEIIGNLNSTKVFYFKNNQEEEVLEIKAKKMNKKIQYLTIHFNIKIPGTKDIERENYFSDEKYKIYFKVEQDQQKLYESEAFTDDGKFNIVQIPLYILKDKISISFYNYKNNNIGLLNKTIEDLTDKNNYGKIFFSKQLSLNHKLNIFNYSSIKEEITFVDYLNKGLKIDLDIAIDFTGSNGAPDESDSLHYWGENEKRNPYERAILSCASVMANYDYDQLFPVYGFGAIIKGQKRVNHCFNINFNSDPNIQFVENILEEYHKCLDKIIFSGPTHFAPIINKIIEEIKKQNDPFDYNVLMILTDGIIDDLQETIDALVEGSYYPLSVIIIGIGNNEDFSKMEKLDGDEIPLISQRGIKRQRDLVQFVPFNKFEGDEQKLSQEVLDEIPRQVIEYYTLNFLYPENFNNNENKKKESNKINENNSFNNSISIDKNSSYIDFQIGNNKNEVQNYQNLNEEDEFNNYSEINKKFSHSIRSDDSQTQVNTINNRNNNLSENCSIYDSLSSENTINTQFSKNIEQNTFNNFSINQSMASNSSFTPS